MAAPKNNQSNKKQDNETANLTVRFSLKETTTANQQVNKKSGVKGFFKKLFKK